MGTANLPNQANLDHQTDRDGAGSFDKPNRAGTVVSPTDMKIMRLLHAMTSEPVKLEILKIVGAMSEAQKIKESPN